MGFKKLVAWRTVRLLIAFAGRDFPVELEDAPGPTVSYRREEAGSIGCRHRGPLKKESRTK